MTTHLLKILNPIVNYSPKMHFTLALVISIAIGVNGQRDPKSGCPKVLKEQPGSLVRPKTCPPYPKTAAVAKTVGSVRDNECLVAGIVGVSSSCLEIMALTKSWIGRLLQ
jgi:hypothetical protein